MTLRLIVALLALLLSLPATAAPSCHGAPTATAAAGHERHAPVKHDAAVTHVCVGCAPLGDWLRAPLAAPLAAPRQTPVASVIRLDLGGAVSPALPPPRLA